MKNFEIVCRGETEFRPTFWSPSLEHALSFVTVLTVFKKSSQVKLEYDIYKFTYNKPL